MTAEVRLTVGEQTELTLPGLGTAGYRWSETLTGDTDAVTVRWQRGFSTDESKPRLAAGDRPRPADRATGAATTLGVRAREGGTNGRGRSSSTLTGNSRFSTLTLLRQASTWF